MTVVDEVHTLTQPVEKRGTYLSMVGLKTFTVQPVVKAGSLQIVTQPVLVRGLTRA